MTPKAKAVAIGGDLHRQLKHASADQGKSMQRLVEEAVREKLAKEQKQGTRP